MIGGGAFNVNADAESRKLPTPADQDPLTGEGYGWHEL